MIKLYNKSSYPNEALKKLLSYVARRMRVSGDVIVKVTQARTGHWRGLAKRGYPLECQLSTKRMKAAGRLLTGTPCGWVHLSLPRLELARGNSVRTASQILYLAKHEMAHIRTFREGTQADNGLVNVRRTKHDQRPIEIQAENIVHECRCKNRQERDREEQVLRDFEKAIRLN